jgi:hypothetical protein
MSRFLCRSVYFNILKYTYFEILQYLADPNYGTSLSSLDSSKHTLYIYISFSLIKNVKITWTLGLVSVCHLSVLVPTPNKIPTPNKN